MNENLIKDLRKTGYTPEIVRHEAINAIESQDKEIERLNKRIEDLNIINEEHNTLNGMIRKELQQKENIIKEVREYLDIDEIIRKNCKRYDVNGIAILEILDKAGDEK